MRIEADSVVRYPRDVVFTACRDDLRQFVPFLPNVRAIDVLERSSEGDKVRLHNVWHGTTELPTGLAPLEDRFLSWDDQAVWDESTWSCEWTIRLHAFGDAVRCRGRSEFVDLGGGRTRLEMRGELAVTFERMRGVASFFADSLGKTGFERKGETFLARYLTANLATIGDALVAYLKKTTNDTSG